MWRNPTFLVSLLVFFSAVMACSQGELPQTPTFTVEVTEVPTSFAPLSTEVPFSDGASEGDTVSVHYHGTLESGEIFDSSREREPISFVLGSGQMIAGFDSAVYGMNVGDTITVRLEPDDAYGERDENLIIPFPIDKLPDGLEEGDNVLFQSGAVGSIVEITEAMFTVDANHRLAGSVLTFEIELMSIE